MMSSGVLARTPPRRSLWVHGFLQSAPTIVMMKLIESNLLGLVRGCCFARTFELRGKVERFD